MADDPQDPDALPLTRTSYAARDPYEVDLGLLYHENTKRTALDDPEDLPSTEPHPVSSRNHLPPGHDAVRRLPPPGDARRPEARPLDETVRGRRSPPGLAPDPLDVEEISTLLDIAYGVTGTGSHPAGEVQRRTVPSHGRSFPLELYPVVRRADGVEPGLYHFRPETRVLERLDDAPSPETLERAFASNTAAGSPLVVVVNAVWDRTHSRFGERGYRWVLVEAGSVLQNLSLGATDLGLGCRRLDPIDGLVNDLVGVDGVEESVVLGAAVGTPSGDGDPGRDGGGRPA